MRIACIAIAVVLLTAPVSTTYGQQDVGKRIGEKIDRAVNRASDELRQSWDEIRLALDRMGIEGRVYARIHWDKSLNDATIDIEVRDRQVVVLKGTVATAAAKNMAIRLATNTVGVDKVVDELAIAPLASRHD